MRFASLRTKPADRVKRSLRQVEAGVSMVKTEKINSIVRTCEFSVGQEEERVARDRLVKQLDSLEQVFFGARAERNAVDEVFGTQIKIVSHDVGGGRFLNGSPLCGGGFRSQLVGDCLRDLALEREYVAQIPIIFLRPHMGVRARVD